MHTKKLLAFLLAAIGTSGIAHADPNISYEVSAANGSNGFDRATWEISPRIITPISGWSYFWSNQLKTVNGGHAVYLGPDIITGNKHTVRFGVFGEGTSSASPSCPPGIDGGPGTACRINAAWDTGKDYQFEIDYSEPAPGSSDASVEGFITEIGSQNKKSVGKVSIPAAWGKLTHSGYLFDEFPAFNGGPKDPTLRACVPYALHTVTLPKFYAAGVEYLTHETAIRLNTGQDKCAIAAGTPNNRIAQTNTTTYSIENGILPGSPGAPK